MAGQTWSVRELPILEAIFNLEEAKDEHGFNSVGPGDVAEEVGLDLDEVRRGIRALYEAGFVEGNDASSGAGWDLFGLRLLERGRRAVGQWPTDDPYVSLVKMIESQIAAEPEGERKTRMKKLLGTLTEVGSDVAGSVLSAFVQQTLGLR